tara:strand:- start:666 stop:1181 length:516 start_codon:yes stop_codon:yes gene_type:complete
MTVLTTTSPSFSNNGTIPAHHTCDHKDISPALTWTGIPESIKSLVFIIDDPDPAAPKMTWVPCMLYNIPPNTFGLAEDITENDLPIKTLQGLNDWQRTGYGGPCPPIGNHRYFHKLYALSNVLQGLQQPTKTILKKAMHGHILPMLNSLDATSVGFNQLDPNHNVQNPKIH